MRESSEYIDASLNARLSAFRSSALTFASSQITRHTGAVTAPTRQFLRVRESHQRQLRRVAVAGNQRAEFETRVLP